MKKRTVIVFLLTVLLILCSSCGKGSKADAPLTTNQGGDGTGSSIQDTTMSSKKEDKQKSNDDFVLPAKGVRPVAVMIDNQGSRVLPQGGLYKAQVIYEIIVEGGITRLMPVFWGTAPKMIGPVRSSRHYFLDYAMENDAIYVHFGYSPQARADIARFKINNINGIFAGQVFWDITKDRGNWQDSYTSMEKVMTYAKKAKYRTTTDKTPNFTYNKNNTAITRGLKAEKIEIHYSDDYMSGYSYDPSRQIYLRSRRGKPHMERNTGKQLTAENIIIQIVPNHRIDGDNYDRQQLGDVGNGNGWYITCGKAEKIKWSKISRTSPTYYTDLQGKRIMLNPGQTWIQVTPSNAKVTIN